LFVVGITSLWDCVACPVVCLVLRCVLVSQWVSVIVMLFALPLDGIAVRQAFVAAVTA
jgi:hypothetical protein